MVSDLNSMSDKIEFLEAEINKLNEEKEKNNNLKRKIANLLLEDSY
jgi:cell division protein FtsB